jgi:hypothetical protein
MDVMQTQDETTYPVDEITQRTPCELHIPFKNLSIKVVLCFLGIYIQQVSAYVDY